MAKATFTVSDGPDKTVDFQVEFDPPIDDSDAEETNAQKVAASLIRIVEACVTTAGGELGVWEGKS